MPALAPDHHRHSRPRAPNLHLFAGEGADYALNVESGAISPLSRGRTNAIKTALRLGDPGRAELLAFGPGSLASTGRQTDIPREIPLKALSLAVAQTCNLGCTYCYAQQGTFGGKATAMPLEVALASVERLFESVKKGENVTLAFMGGEPLTNRKVLHAATSYAAQVATERGNGVGFTLTTNATLLKPEDVELFQKYRFTLTVSIDGLGTTNDRLRPFLSGKGSFTRIAESIRMLFAVDRRSFQVVARVTVTPQNLNVLEIMTGLLEMGFDGVMFSPMLSAPSGQAEMQANDLDRMLAQLISCSETFQQNLRQGKFLSFGNLIKTIQRIHAYQGDQYPCGAGGGYMGVSAKGDLFACHRFVDDDEGRMGDVYDGVDPKQQIPWLKERHLSNQDPCKTCWARYLCSGGCHYESIKRGRPACDYIRGWLHHCLGVYAELIQNEPKSLKKILAHG